MTEGVVEKFGKSDTCISGSIASPNEKAIAPKALKALNLLREELPCTL